MRCGQGWRRSRKATVDTRGVWSWRSFQDGVAQRRGAVLVQQFEQLRRLAAGGLALGEGPIEQRLAFRHSLFQPAGGRGMKGSALLLQRGIAVLDRAPAAGGRSCADDGQLDGAVEDAHRMVRGY